MDNIQQKHIYSSTEVIEDILSKLGIERETNSTYVEHSLPNGEYLRLRISNHGIYLQRWFDKNKERRMNGENIPKLNIGSNLAITFAPNEQECIAQGETFPMKVRNDTSAKTEFGNNVKPQFTITHICYNTWELSKQDVELIGNTIQTYVTVGGEFTEPIQDDNKVSIWIDQSNSYPNRLQGKEYSKTNNANQTQNNKTNKNESKNMSKKNTIRLTESDLKRVISESVKRVLREGNENFFDAELQKIWMGIQQIGSRQGRHIKDEMKIHGFEQLVPKYEMLEKYADKMREILQQMFTEVDSEWAWNRKNTTKFSTPREKEGMGFSTDGIRAF